MTEFADIRDKVLHLAAHLDYSEREGKLESGGNRMLTLSGRAYGRMRSELIKTLGEDLARGLLKRYGFQAGFDDAHYLCLKFPGLTLEEQMHLGTILHQRRGAAVVETVPEETRVDPDQGILEISSRWRNSLEAEQHLEQIGPAKSPVCWSLTGYAGGHLSFLLQRDVTVVETECMAQGKEFCSFRVGIMEEMTERFPGCMNDYQNINLLQMFEDLQNRVQEQSRHITELEARNQQATPFDGLIGSSPAMNKLKETARLVAGVDSTILVIGESGTGKELFTRALHESSPRAREPYVTVNCATLTESLQNAELFGYARGAFTGANRDKAGLFEDADGGTLFLDEIGELSTSAQAAILRVLQENKISRVGETRERTVDVRLIAATHRNLEEMVSQGRFRQDLFFRLNVVQLKIPPLRERENDALLLASHFLEHFSRKFNKNVISMSPAVVRLFLKYRWPGNVRELQNAMERAVLLCATSQLEIDDLPECLKAALDTQNQPEPPTPQQVDEAPYDEKAALISALRATGGKKQEAAKRLGMSRATLWRKLQKYGLSGEKSYWTQPKP